RLPLRQKVEGQLVAVVLAHPVEAGAVGGGEVEAEAEVLRLARRSGRGRSRGGGGRRRRSNRGRRGLHLGGRGRWLGGWWRSGLGGLLGRGRGRHVDWSVGEGGRSAREDDAEHRF